MLYFVPVLCWCVVCLQLCKEEGSFPVSVITEMRDMSLYVVPLSMSLLGFGMGTMLANFHMRGVVNMLVRNASPRGPMCFRCLMFSLSGPYILSVYSRFLIGLDFLFITFTFLLHLLLS